MDSIIPLEIINNIMKFMSHPSAYILNEQIKRYHACIIISKINSYGITYRTHFKYWYFKINKHNMHPFIYVIRESEKYYISIKRNHFIKK